MPQVFNFDEADRAFTEWMGHWKLYAEVRSTTKSNATFPQTNSETLATIDATFRRIHVIGLSSCKMQVEHVLETTLPKSPSARDEFQAVTCAVHLAIGENVTNLTKLMSGDDYFESEKSQLNSYSTILEFLKCHAFDISTPEQVVEAVTLHNQVRFARLETKKIQELMQSCLDKYQVPSGPIIQTRQQLLQEAAAAFGRAPHSVATLLTDDLDGVFTVAFADQLQRWAKYDFENLEWAQVIGTFKTHGDELKSLTESRSLVGRSKDGNLQDLLASVNQARMYPGFPAAARLLAPALAAARDTWVWMKLPPLTLTVPSEQSRVSACVSEATTALGKILGSLRDVFRSIVEFKKTISEGHDLTPLSTSSVPPEAPQGGRCTISDANFEHMSKFCGRLDALKLEYRKRLFETILHHLKRVVDSVGASNAKIAEFVEAKHGPAASEILTWINSAPDGLVVPADHLSFAVQVMAHVLKYIKDHHSDSTLIEPSVATQWNSILAQGTERSVWVFAHKAASQPSNPIFSRGVLDQIEAQKMTTNKKLIGPLLDRVKESSSWTVMVTLSCLIVIDS